MEEREEITEKLKYLDEQEEEINSLVIRFQREEEEEDIEISHTLSRLEEMRDCCSEKDYELHQLIDEHKCILDTIKAEKNEFADEFSREIAARRQKVDEEREGLRQRLNEMQEQNDER